MALNYKSQITESQYNQLLRLNDRLTEQLQGSSLDTCYRWASHRRVMGQPFPGPYSADHHPWVVEIQNSEAAFNYWMKGAQLGVTECGINRAFFVLDTLQRDVLYVLPTDSNASDFSKVRFDGALDHSTYLNYLFTVTNTVELKKTGNGASLYIRGSKSDNKLKSIPVSELILDEVDEMSQKVIWLALERLSGQTRKCVWGISTPTIPSYGIHRLYMTGTQEQYVFQCPHCSRWTEFIWPDCIQIVGESVFDPRCQQSYLKCKECQAKLEQNDKLDFLKSKVVGGKAHFHSTAANANRDIRSGHISQLYSYTITPGDLVVSYFRGLGDEIAAKEFYNSKLGLPFVGEGAQVTDDMIQECIGDHTSNDPRPTTSDGLRTLGVDQGKTNYWVVCQWSMLRETGDLNASAHMKVLAAGKFLEDEWDYLSTLMQEWQIHTCVMDADPQINEARRFARAFPGHVYLCRYRRGKTAREIAISEEDSGAPIATVDRTNWLTATLSRFRTRRVTLHSDVSQEFRAHMRALVRTYEKDTNGDDVATFKKTDADHYAHAMNYSEIALPLAASLASGEDIQTFL